MALEDMSIAIQTDKDVYQPGDLGVNNMHLLVSSHPTANFFISLKLILK